MRNTLNLKTGNVLSLALIFLLAGILSCKPTIDENKMSEELYAQSVELAKESGQKILIVFGADWCGDCISLRERFKENENISKLLLENYLVIHIDVGRFDKNTEFSAKFGSPEKKGIPALVIVDPQDQEKLIAVTKGGEFSSARSMSDEAILKYLKDKIK